MFATSRALTRLWTFSVLAHRANTLARVAHNLGCASLLFETAAEVSLASHPDRLTHDGVRQHLTARLLPRSAARSPAAQAVEGAMAYNISSFVDFPAPKNAYHLSPCQVFSRAVPALLLSPARTYCETLFEKNLHTDISLLAEAYCSDCRGE